MNEEQKQQRKKRVKLLLTKLKKLFPEKKHRLTELTWDTPWRLLVAVILSAQCTDKKVNEVISKLFFDYPNLEDFIAISQTTLEKYIYQTGFYRNKAKTILAAAHIISNQFGGEIPKTMAELVTIPGVARKTANVVMGNAFNRVEGIAVDTHVKRFALRFDLTDHTSPNKIEKDLMEIFPKQEWFVASNLIIQYGRTYGPAQNWDTDNDPLLAIYPEARKDT